MGKRRKNPLQLAFNILPIDEAATRAAVEERLEEVRQYRQIGLVRREAVLTPSYAPRYHGATNEISKPTENIAVWNVDKEAELKEKDRLLDLAMSRLSSVQREVIERSYLDDEGEFDFISCSEMGLGDRTFRRIKVGAIKILAFALKLEIIEDTKETSNSKYEVG
ncbi:ArpU family phage packaging/lysis transcriptional regulator [Paenibacillus sp. IHBB 10380]|uniref:ArpU family phage packaging/lysis transcriptional regulator n=1 Tax=Paenibacillus sp. IHBB 10380 TaxID=1566358 RepID=UPI0005CFD502|nr:ArpU family phage packaging/lysis transcriptional regulator [Paenibacillus sp. IHBB 10380]AJS59221.1 transcriptional regulator [Paenibacillus sp. IHBB 10380]